MVVGYGRTELLCLKMADSKKQPAGGNFDSSHAPILYSRMDKPLRGYTVYYIPTILM